MERLTIKDIEKVSGIIADPSVFNTAKDDGVTDPYSFARETLKNPSHLWLQPEENTLLMFKWQNYVMMEMHIVIRNIKSSRVRSRQSCIDSCRWIFNNTSTEKVITMISASNIPAISLAFECGMKHEGLIKEAMMVNGTLEDLVLLGSTKQHFIDMYGGSLCHQ